MGRFGRPVIGKQVRPVRVPRIRGMRIRRDFMSLLFSTKNAYDLQAFSVATLVVGPKILVPLLSAKNREPLARNLWDSQSATRP